MQTAINHQHVGIETPGQRLLRLCAAGHAWGQPADLAQVGAHGRADFGLIVNPQYGQGPGGFQVIQASLRVVSSRRRVPCHQRAGSGQAQLKACSMARFREKLGNCYYKWGMRPPQIPASICRWHKPQAYIAAARQQWRTLRSRKLEIYSCERHSRSQFPGIAAVASLALCAVRQPRANLLGPTVTSTAKQEKS